MNSEHKIATTAGEHVRFGKALGTRRLLGSNSTAGGFGLVEHDLPARRPDHHWMRTAPFVARRKARLPMVSGGSSYVEDLIERMAPGP